MLFVTFSLAEAAPVTDSPELSISASPGSQRRASYHGEPQEGEKIPCWYVLSTGRAKIHAGTCVAHELTM